MALQVASSQLGALPFSFITCMQTRAISLMNVNALFVRSNKPMFLVEFAQLSSTDDYPLDPFW